MKKENETKGEEGKERIKEDGKMKYKLFLFLKESANPGIKLQEKERMFPRS